MAILSLALAAAASIGVDDICLPKHLVRAVEQGEALIVNKAPFVVRRGPTGEHQRYGCVRIYFAIDSNGLATDLRIGHSSGSRVVDLSAIESIRKSEFSARGSKRPVSLVFVYSGEIN